MKKFVNEKFQKALFNTYVKKVSFADEVFIEECEIHSMYAYENIKLDFMLQAQENESNILIRRNKNSKNEIGKLLYF